MKNYFSIIGGMGTAATESYIHLLNKRTPSKKDQDYLNYILVNHATIPDRTSYILDHTKPNPLPDLIEDIKQQSQMLPAPKFFALPCNTAHYFFKQLQAATNIKILNMPDEAVESISKKYSNIKRVGLIATKGTIYDHIYDHKIKNAGYKLVLPNEKIERETMKLIYNDIKVNDYVNAELYHHILSEMINDLKCDVVILGCTELSLAQERAGNHSFNIIDAQSVLVNQTIKLALKNRNK